MREYSKPVKRLIRERMTEAYERELHRELTLLDESFTECVARVLPFAARAG